MDKRKEELKIILLILHKMPEWGNDYDLHRAANFTFRLFYSSELVRELADLGYITRADSHIKGVWMNSITESGLSFLMHDYDTFAQNVLEAFSDKELAKRLIEKGK